MSDRRIPMAAAFVLGSALLLGCHKQNEVSASPPETSPPVQANQPSPPGPSTAAKTNEGAANPANKGSSSVAALKVKNAFMTSKQPVNWKGITVETTGNTVHLSGTVPDEHQKALAVKLAKQAVGSQYQVMDMLTVAGGKS